MDDALPVDICQSAEYVHEDRSYLCVGGRPTLEEGGQCQGHEGEDKREAVLVVAEGLEEGDAWLLQLGEDLGFAAGVMGLDAVCLGDDFEGAVFVPVYLGSDAAGDVLTTLVRAYPLPILLACIVIIATGSSTRRSRSLL